MDKGRRTMNRQAYLMVLLAFLTGTGLSSFYFADLTPEVTVNRTEGDVYQTTKVDPPRYNYIQANNHQVNYSFESSGVLIDDIDSLITVYGSSMRPTMFTGHKALAVDYENQSLSEGDIVSANDVVHRIKASYLPTNGYYLTQGDNNEGSERINESEIDSIVVGVLYTE